MRHSFRFGQSSPSNTSILGSSSRAGTVCGLCPRRVDFFIFFIHSPIDGPQVAATFLISLLKKHLNSCPDANTPAVASRGCLFVPAIVGSPGAGLCWRLTEGSRHPGSQLLQQQRFHVTNARLTDVPGAHGSGLSTGSPGVIACDDRPGVGVSLTSVLSRARSEDERLQFMRGLQDVWGVDGRSVLSAFDLSSFPVICDLGGCSGALAKECVSLYPGCRVTVFDIPEVVQTAKTHFPLPEGARIRFCEGGLPCALGVHGETQSRPTRGSGDAGHL
nr:PREDICTED: acetylserotonin O-methyltransferase [Equus przewalskii]